MPALLGDHKEDMDNWCQMWLEPMWMGVGEAKRDSVQMRGQLNWRDRLHDRKLTKKHLRDLWLYSPDCSAMAEDSVNQGH
jgi:hypothetical protein